MTFPELIARPLIAGLFIHSGVNTLLDSDAKSDAAEKVTRPISEATGLGAALLVKINGAAQVAAGVALVFGILPRPAAAVLAVSLVPTTLAGHRFWEKDGAERKAQTIQFLKNASVLGGLLVAATSTGGRPSVPWRAKRAIHGVIDTSSDKLGSIRH